MSTVSYPDFLAGWAAAWSLQPAATVRVELRVGNRAYDKWANSLAAETDLAVGSFTVWDTGELEAEVMEVDTETRTYVDSTVVTDGAELAAHLAAFIRAVETAGRR